MVMTKKDSILFVGNIPWDATEDEVRGLMEEVGPITEMRLVTDKDSGKRRGYGFVEFADRELAEAARKHLNGRELRGRTVRIDLSNEAKQAQADGGARGEQGGAMTAEAIGRKLSEMTFQQLFDLLRQVKMMADNDFAKARTLLLNNPQLTQALFQAELMLGLLPAAQQQQQQQQFAHQIPAQPGPQQPVHFAGQEAMQPTMMQPGFQQQAFQMAPMQPPQPNEAQMAQQMQMGMAAQMTEQQRALLAQVASMTPEQVEALPEEQKQTVMQLKMQLQQQGLSM